MVWKRKISNEAIQKVGDEGPTVHSIQVEECEAQTAVKERLTTNAPTFAWQALSLVCWLDDWHVGWVWCRIELCQQL
jgi:hypothetical protein